MVISGLLRVNGLSHHAKQASGGLTAEGKFMMFVVGHSCGDMLYQTCQLVHASTTQSTTAIKKFGIFGPCGCCSVVSSEVEVEVVKCQVLPKTLFRSDKQG